jgi:serine/threonine-protein kinase
VAAPPLGDAATLHDAASAISAPLPASGSTPSAPLPASAPASLEGQIIAGKWRVLGVLGRGGMGVVYEAQNIAIGKRVALKFIEAGADPEACRRFQREAEAASAVESAHIVEVFDSGTTEQGQPYLVMELLRGESLGSRLRREGKLPVDEAVAIIAQALRGLARAHAAGVLHRDLKPDNVFLVERDDTPLFVKLLDFGVSKFTPRPGAVGLSTITRKGTVLGTPYYMSPEQARGDVELDGRSDLFSMGAVLFECLVGHPPCAGQTTYEAVIVALCSHDTPDIRVFDPSFPAPLAAVVKRSLTRDRQARYASAGEMHEALRSLQPALPALRDAPPSGAGFRPPVASAPGPIDAREPPPTRSSWATGPSQPTPPPLRRPGRLVALGLLAATSAFGLTLMVIRSRAPQPVVAVTSAAPPTTHRVQMRIDIEPPQAKLLVDGQEHPGRVIEGPALSTHLLVVEADGFERLERSERLDGRRALSIVLAPLAASASAPPASASSTATRPPATSPASPAGSSKGIQLKVRL